MQDDGSDLLMYCHRQVSLILFCYLGKQNNILLPVDHLHHDFVNSANVCFCAVIHYKAGWKFSILAFKKKLFYNFCFQPVRNI